MQIVETREDFLRELHLPEGCIGAEIGVLNGDFSKMILDIVNPAKLIMIDPFMKSEKTYQNGLPVAYSDSNDLRLLLDRFKNEVQGNANSRVQIKRMFSYEALVFHEKESLDFVYHDASHLYEDVKRDLNDWLPKIKNGGFICGHDYIEHEDFGVKKAVDEFCLEYGFQMFLFNKNGGDYALR